MLEEMHNTLFTSSYLLDPHASSQDPCATPNGILEPTCHPTSMVHHRWGRADAAGCLWGGAGPAWAQPMDAICRSEHWENWEPIQHHSARSSAALHKTKQPSRHRAGVPLSHLPAPQPGLRLDLYHLQGRPSPVLSKTSRLSPAVSYFLQQQEQYRERQDSRCNCENHQLGDLILQLVSASMLERVIVTIKVMGKLGEFPLLLERISTH